MDRDSLKSMTVAQLKEILAGHSLPVSGRKAELIDRLIENHEDLGVEDLHKKEEIDISESRQDTAAEAIETVVSDIGDGPVTLEESDVTLQTMILIGAVILALGLVILSL
ncbi:MAG TPA: hypothetical protein D7I12_04170 [Candidatus Poseidoniales archaeon]|nr:MAG TPA: hypothetical protein D7I12_04170 [Candidatus Poseidoniales archaeon]